MEAMVTLRHTPYGVSGLVLREAYRTRPSDWALEVYLGSEEELGE